ncbi:MAG: DUF5658 family protein [Bryobacterales bacterium]|nr:DUF5658 family protein [Bryobacterales bacterium]
MNYLEVFVLLQLLDFLTTLVGLRVGAGEASPFISWLMQATTPLTGLMIAKLIGVAWGAFCLLRHKPFAIRLANYFFAGVVVWNLVQISARVAQ